MRSAIPMERNPWPHDMVISIEDDPDAVVELLWVREAWGLHPVGDLPPLLTDAPGDVRETPDAASWEAAWPALWDAVTAHAGVVIDPGLFDEVAAAPPGSPARAALIAQLRGPSWRDRFGDAAFDDRYLSWTERRFQERISLHARPLEEHPERRSLAALVPAWEAGLMRIVTIPCRGEHTRVIGDSALLVTDATRADPELYSAALASFTRHAEPGA